MPDPFDFSSFIAKAQNPDSETRAQVLQEAVSEETGSVMNEVAPRLWCIMQEQMMKDPGNNIHLNAVINAGIYAVLSWVSACTPESNAEGDSDEMLRTKVVRNLDHALSHCRSEGKAMSTIAHNAGKLKLMEDALQGLGNTLVSNSMVIKGIHEHIRKDKA